MRAGTEVGTPSNTTACSVTRLHHPDAGPGTRMTATGNTASYGVFPSYVCPFHSLFTFVWDAWLADVWDRAMLERRLRKRARGTRYDKTTDMEDLSILVYERLQEEMQAAQKGGLGGGPPGGSGAGGLGQGPGGGYADGPGQVIDVEAGPAVQPQRQSGGSGQGAGKEEGGGTAAPSNAGERS